MVAMMVATMRFSVVVVPDAEDDRVEENDELYIGIEHQTTSEFSGSWVGMMILSSLTTPMCQFCSNIAVSNHYLHSCLYTINLYHHAPRKDLAFHTC
jgi:hypothetical protein